jgi:hypothetical protein
MYGLTVFGAAFKVVVAREERIVHDTDVVKPVPANLASHLHQITTPPPSKLSLPASAQQQRVETDCAVLLLHTSNPC